MAGNPVDAFMRGFNAVNTLEANRQQRAFAEERQSRLRTLWQREDEEYSKIKLDRYRAEKLTELEATSDGIMMELKQGIENAPDEETRVRLINQWEAYRDNPDVLRNEIIHRMISNDPQFAEHAAISAGYDPADGLLVRDKSRPVSGMGIVSPEDDPNGRGGVYWQIDAITGKGQPMTYERSNRKDDNVVLHQFTPLEMVRMLGPGVSTSKHAITQMLWEAVGGNNQAEAAAQAATQQAPQEQPNALQRTQEQIEETAAAAEETPAEQPDRFMAAVDQDRWAPARAGERFAARDARTKDKYEKRIDDNLDYLEANEGNATKQAAGVLRLAANTFAWGAAKMKDKVVGVADVAISPAVFAYDVIAEAAGGDEAAQAAAENVSEQQAEATTTKAATSNADIPSGVNAQDYDANNLSQPGQGAAQTVMSTPTPTTEAAVRGAVRGVMTPPAGRGGRPDKWQLYNAVGLLKAGAIQHPHLLQYAQTGTFAPPIQQKFKGFLDDDTGVLSVLNETTGQLAGQYQVGRPKDLTKDLTDDMTDADIKAEYERLFEADFMDEDGNVNRPALQFMSNAMHVAANQLGLTKKERISRDYVMSIQRAIKTISDFSADSSQFIDLWPRDPELGSNMASLALIAEEIFGLSPDPGFLSKNGKELDRFLFDYGITMWKASNGAWDAQKFLEQVIGSELRLRNQIKDREGSERDPTPRERTKHVKEEIRAVLGE